MPLVIGGNHIQDEDVKTQIEKLQSERAILVAPVNEDANDDPELKKCKTIKEVFRAYKPNAEISVKDEEGSTEESKVDF